MRILFATFRSSRDFLDRLTVDDDHSVGVVRVNTKARYDEGEHVILEIGFPRLPNRILMRAEYRGAHGEDALFALAHGEEHKRDFLVAVAAGRATASWKRRHRRFPIRLPARFVVEGDEMPLRGDAETEELGSGGLSLRTSRTLPDGAKVTIILDPCDGSNELEFGGRVVWNRQDDEVSGVGIQFDKLGGDEMKRLRWLIRDVKLSGKTTDWDTKDDDDAGGAGDSTPEEAT